MLVGKHTKGGKSLVVWKQLKTTYVHGNGYVTIAKLRIPCRAARVIFDGPYNMHRKCRAEWAYVEEIFTEHGDHVEIGYSLHDSSFKYEIGKKVVPNSWDPSIDEQCTYGIHFFLKKEDALNW